MGWTPFAATREGAAGIPGCLHLASLCVRKGLLMEGLAHVWVHRVSCLQSGDHVDGGMPGVRLFVL